VLALTVNRTIPIVILITILVFFDGLSTELVSWCTEGPISSTAWSREEIRTICPRAGKRGTSRHKPKHKNLSLLAMVSHSIEFKYKQIT